MSNLGSKEDTNRHWITNKPIDVKGIIDIYISHPKATKCNNNDIRLGFLHNEQIKNNEYEGFSSFLIAQGHWNQVILRGLTEMTNRSAKGEKMYMYDIHSSVGYKLASFSNGTEKTRITIDKQMFIYHNIKGPRSFLECWTTALGDGLWHFFTERVFNINTIYDSSFWVALFTNISHFISTAVVIFNYRRYLR